MIGAFAGSIPVLKVYNKIDLTDRDTGVLVNGGDKVSAVAGRTVARPSGILGGSILAAVGLAIFTWYSQHRQSCL